MIVTRNGQAENASRLLNQTAEMQGKYSEKLSSGFKINRAADDAAGLAISEKMRRQVRGLTQAVANAQDGISAVQTAEGAMNEVHDMLQRLEELAVKAANATLQTGDREFIDKEVQQIVSEIDRVASTTTFNERKLLDGTFSDIGLQVGAEATQTISISIIPLTASGLGIDDIHACGLTSVDSEGISNANTMNILVKAAIKTLSGQRADLGAIQNRLEHTIKNLNNVVENTASAEAQIRDTDVASEMVKFSNNQILVQAGQAMLAQANQANQGALSLLR